MLAWIQCDLVFQSCPEMIGFLSKPHVKFRPHFSIMKIYDPNILSTCKKNLLSDTNFSQNSSYIWVPSIFKTDVCYILGRSYLRKQISILIHLLPSLCCLIIGPCINALDLFVFHFIFLADFGVFDLELRFPWFIYTFTL